MPATHSNGPVRILRTRGEEPPPAPSVKAARWRWKWIAWGIVFALLAALTARPSAPLAVSLGVCSAACLLASRRIGRPGSPPRDTRRVRISASRKEGRHGVFWRSRTKNCAACHTPLGGDSTVTCSRNTAHVIHRRCKDLMQGKCPHCGNLLR